MSSHLDNFRVKSVRVGHKTVEVIYQRRWALQVIATVGETAVKLFRNGVSKCEVHGVNSNCFHVKSLMRTAEHYNIWS